MEKAPRQEVIQDPSEIKRELYERAGKRSQEQVKQLIDEVGLILDGQKEKGRGKLKGTIAEVSHGENGREFFVDDKVAYLPPEGNAVFVGDLHGDMEALVSILEQSQFVENMAAGKTDQRMVFLGDYADRGAKDVETLEVILALKARYPDNVVLLSGNHEDADVNDRYGMIDSLQEKFGNDEVYSRYNQLFKKLPLACVAANGIVALHGGIPSQGINSLQDLNSPDRAFGIHWNDPNERVEDFGPSTRGGSIKQFGKRAFDKVMSRIGGEVMIRGHEYFPDGIDTKFGGRLATVFSNGGERSESSGYKGDVKHPRFLWLVLDKVYTRIDQSMGAEVDYRKPKYEAGAAGARAEAQVDPEKDNPNVTAELKGGDQFAVRFKGEPIALDLGGKRLEVIDSSFFSNTPLMITDPETFDPGEMDTGFKGMRVGEKVILGRNNPGRFEFPNNVSREHCEVTYDGNQITVKDLGSRNGTKVVFKK